MVSYFQTIGCLPNLQDTSVSDSTNAASRDYWWLRSRNRSHQLSVRRFDVTYQNTPSQSWSPARKFPPLEEAALGFFRHYAEFPFETHIVSIKVRFLSNRTYETS